MDNDYTLEEANAAVPLLASIAREVEERRSELRALRRDLRHLYSAVTPEGLASSISDLEVRIRECDGALQDCLTEIADLGGHVLRMHPLTIHLRGQTRSGEVVFCWQAGEASIDHGHKTGEEQDARRPLHLRLTNQPTREAG